MDLKGLYDNLKTVFPTAYLDFPEEEKPEPPYICYYDTGTDNFVADNKVYHIVLAVNVELFTKQKDEAAEAAVEAVLDALDLPWEKAPEFLEDENIFLVTYTMEV